jgi:hypothetical protein
MGNGISYTCAFPFDDVSVSAAFIWTHNVRTNTHETRQNKETGGTVKHKRRDRMNTGRALCSSEANPGMSYILANLIESAHHVWDLLACCHQGLGKLD